MAIDSKDGHDILRHSTAHVMAQAVQDLFPDAKLGIGPPITDGFYYDFDVETPFVPEDLEKIETRMRKIIKEGQRFSRRVTTDADALDELKDEPYKIELIGLKGSGKSDDAAEGASVEVGAGELTIYDNVNRNGEVAWSDLCRGPHLPTTKRIPAFKLMRSAAAYWRGDEKNKQLQRIYGTAWESKEALDAHLHRIEEAERRDHRRLGRDLDLYSFPDEIGSGLPVFHPKGGVIKREMEDYVRRRHIEEGFEYVGTPHIAKEGLFYTSGHLPYYGEGMFPALDVDGMDYRLKAMNCPMHNLIFRSRQRSYRELPLRLFEFGSVYRHEKSGVIHGLTRVRGFAQDDSHSYVTKEQAPAEIKHLLDFCLGLFRDFGLDDFYLELSTRDDSKPDKFIGSDEDWELATKVLEDVCIESGSRARPGPGRRGVLRPEGLGPGARRDRPHLADVDHPVRLQPALGRAVQPRVRRVRRLAPAAGDDPLRQVRLDRAVHRRARRALRRRVPALARAGAGAGDPGRRRRSVDYLYDVAKQMQARGLRVEVDDSDDRMQKKIRNAQLQKVPFMMIAGARRRRGRRRLVPLPRRPPGQRGLRSRTRSPGSWPPWSRASRCDAPSRRRRTPRGGARRRAARRRTRRRRSRPPPAPAPAPPPHRPRSCPRRRPSTRRRSRRTSSWSSWRRPRRSRRRCSTRRTTSSRREARGCSARTSAGRSARQGMGIEHKETSGQPMPTAEAEYVVVGLTNGPGFHANPCLADQVAWVKERGLLIAAYSVISWPDEAAQEQYGGLREAGYAQAQFNVAVDEGRRPRVAAGLARRRAGALLRVEQQHGCQRRGGGRRRAGLPRRGLPGRRLLHAVHLGVAGRRPVAGRARVAGGGADLAGGGAGPLWQGLVDPGRRGGPGAVGPGRAGQEHHLPGRGGPPRALVQSHAG